MLSLLCGINLCPQAIATKWPNYYWDIKGVVQDWKTKKPVQGAQVLVFLDGAGMHQGWNPEQGDYPDLPQTSAKGEFFATAVLYRTPPKERPEAIETLVMASGYVTSRFKFSASEARFQDYPKGSATSFGVIGLPILEISSYEDRAEEVSFYHTSIGDSSTAVRVAKAALRRKGLDASAHNLDKPESVQELNTGNRKTWRVSFNLKLPSKGGQIVVVIDAKTGRCQIGAGE